jgi:hypothetical protein
MNLEIIEIVRNVEDAFGFSIPDEDAAKFNTAGSLYDYVLAHRLRAKRTPASTASLSTEFGEP